MQADPQIGIVAVTLLQNIHYAPLVINKLLVSMATLVIVGGLQLHCSLDGHCSSRQLNLLGAQLGAISSHGIAGYSNRALQSIFEIYWEMHGECKGGHGKKVEGVRDLRSMCGQVPPIFNAQ